MQATLLLPCLVTLAVLACPAQAAGTAGDSQGHSSCLAKADSTAGMIDCIGAEYRAQDARLNAAYKARQQTLADARRRQLRDAQRAWIAYRDANCAFYDDPDGGTLARLAANQCMLDMTAARAAELERLGEP